ncbi:MAG: hypothetical protein HQL67_04015 [Magnetococcales bacterium]|nr:hypothetical protein [Magnetococcales bacterium]
MMNTSQLGRAELSFFKLISPMVSVVGSVSLAALLGAGLFDSYMIRHNQSMSLSEPAAFTTGTFYPIPHRISGSFSSELNRESANQSWLSGPFVTTASIEPKPVLALSNLETVQPILLANEEKPQPEESASWSVEPEPISVSPKPRQESVKAAMVTPPPLPARPSSTMVTPLPRLVRSSQEMAKPAPLPVQPNPTPSNVTAEIEKPANKTPGLIWGQEETVITFAEKLDRYHQFKLKNPPLMAIYPGQAVGPELSDGQLQRQIEAGQGWLTGSAPGFSIQLMLVSDHSLGRLDTFMQRTDLEKYAEELYLFPLKDKRYLIYFGRFSSRIEAELALKELPVALQKSGIFILPLQKIREKVKNLQE